MRQCIGQCRGLLVGLSLVLLGSQQAPAQAPTGRQAKDEAGVRQAGKDYLAAMSRGDPKALADLWTSEGSYTDETGRTLKVRDLFDKGAGSLGPARTPKNVSVRFLSDDVAIEEGEFETPAVNGSAGSSGKYSAMWVRQGGKWKLDSVRETVAASKAGGEPLAALDVFTGDWTGEINKMTIRVSAKWDAGKKFLRRDVSMASGKASLGGTQQIGWDPLSGHIKSWMFNDDGSYGEGFWNLEGNSWMVLSTRVLPDGKISKATQIYKFPDKNTLVWKVIRGSIDGNPTDDFEVMFKRSSK